MKLIIAVFSVVLLSVCATSSIGGGHWTAVEDICDASYRTTAQAAISHAHNTSYVLVELTKPQIKMSGSIRQFKFQAYSKSNGTGGDFIKKCNYLLGNINEPSQVTTDECFDIEDMVPNKQCQE